MRYDPVIEPANPAVRANARSGNLAGHITVYACMVFIMLPAFLYAQRTNIVTEASGRQITLTEVVVRSGMDAPGFIRRVQADTSFYKAFRNLRILNYSSLNDVRMMDKKGRLKASQASRTRQWASRGCRVTTYLDESHTGDYYDRKGGYNYYTAELYHALFFSFDTVCGEHNRVGNQRPVANGKSGIEKHKEQLKMLFFNPGADIPGIPLMGDKVKMFDDDHARLYDFEIDMADWKGSTCYVFRVKAKESLTAFQEDRIVIDRMETYFDYKTFEVLARQYDMSYNAGIYDFDVSFEVELTHAAGYLVPSLIRYNGNWDIPFKKREWGVFTATIFDVSVQ